MSLLAYRNYSSPIGKLRLVSKDNCLVAINFENDLLREEDLSEDFTEKSHEILDRVCTQLDQYFLGERKEFDLPILLEGTEFQKKVWGELLNVPYGKTISYSEQAQRIGSPKAVRAVGATNGKNHLPIVVPCHRVIGKSGQLTGYAGGLGIKKFLLGLEQSA